MRASSPIPLYHRIFLVLRQRIADGEDPPGGQLAPEEDLAAEFQVSRATIRQAVGELVNAGLVSRRQGLGTFILPGAREMTGGVFVGNLVDLIGEVRRAKIRDISVEHDVPIPARIAEHLQLEGETGTIVHRTRLRDDVAFGYTVNHLPSHIGRKLTAEELAEKPLMDILDANGVVIESARQTLCAQLADSTVSEALGIPLASAVLFVERLNLGEEGTPVEFVQSWYRGDLYKFIASLHPGGGDLRRQFA